MPRSKGSPNLSPVRKAKIAAGKALGKSQQAIALQTGVSLSTVAHFRDDSLIQKFKAKYAGELEKLWRMSLTGMFEDVASIDPEIRIKTRSQVIRAITAGDFAPSKFDPPSDGGGEFTLEELLLVHRKTEVSR